MHIPDDVSTYSFARTLIRLELIIIFLFTDYYILNDLLFFHFAPIIIYVWARSARTFCACNIIYISSKIIFHNVYASCHMLNSSRDTLLDLEPMPDSVQKL